MEGTQQQLPPVLLVAEDDEDHFFLIREVLEKLGTAMTLRHVQDGEELMDYLFRRGKYAGPQKAPGPNLILLDLNMPRKNGREVLKEIKSDAKWRHIPVIVLTSSRALEDQKYCYEQGANCLILKPLGFNQWMNFAKTFARYWLEMAVLPPSDTHGNYKIESSQCTFD